ncbi:hypothetical protein MSNKSG1_04781 [Marinobacter santoriniensis NKSG1]|uniref:Uncharacterized protein n=1 Tax=Marinobacter santoriniensis NKSG1 TaxID=1288826 RepID=M7CSN4_9GAMM|nr:hypothetical protein [Marinobacter santoriniensis]EMP56621.1 hypothetical protein MSNKSG1_04781 [Marinobacter santoriniensis NKSG1]
MPNFDQDFEATRLAMLAKQYPEIVKANGEVVFCSEDDESRLSGTRWTVEDDIFEKATESGFKVHLIELLDNFIEYRGQCNELPKREGVVRFGEGGLNIEWLPDGSTHLSN